MNYREGKDFPSSLAIEFKNATVYNHQLWVVELYWILEFGKRD